jgi:hypothetical protein
MSESKEITLSYYLRDNEIWIEIAEDTYLIVKGMADIKIMAGGLWSTSSN